MKNEIGRFDKRAACGAFTVSMIGEFIVVSDRTIDRLLARPSLIHSLLDPGHLDQLAPSAKQSWFKRLLGKSGPEGEAAPTLQLQSGEGVQRDVDKAWHGIHYLLTGTAWEGEAPLNFIAAGGTPIGDEDVGYAPARALRSAQVMELHDALRNINGEMLRAKFDPSKLTEAEIYPDIWDEGDGAFDYLVSYFEELKGFIATAANNGMGMLVLIT